MARTHELEMKQSGLHTLVEEADYDDDDNNDEKSCVEKCEEVESSRRQTTCL